MASRLRIGAALLGATALLSLSTLAAAADVIVEPGDNKDKKYGYDITLVKDVGNETGRDEYGTVLIPLKVKENG
ncbi:MAG: hypothetical protein QOF58_690, partial [Pseudonocardiales bacterium]|nr:hypothetical protein [Pseudonocardiales bacterium]